MNRVWYDNTQRYDVKKTFLYTPFSLTYVPPPGAHGANGESQRKVRSSAPPMSPLMPASKVKTALHQNFLAAKKERGKKKTW